MLPASNKLPDHCTQGGGVEGGEGRGEGRGRGKEGGSRAGRKDCIMGPDLKVIDTRSGLGKGVCILSMCVYNAQVSLLGAASSQTLKLSPGFFLVATRQLWTHMLRL